jgi:hypothetical protein
MRLSQVGLHVKGWWHGIGSPRQRTALLVVLAAAFALRVAWCVYAAGEPHGGDPASYYLYGKSIGHGHGYNNVLRDLVRAHEALAGNPVPPSVPTALFPPGYPAVLGGLFWVMFHTPFSGSLVAASATLNVVLGVAMVLMTFELARRVFDVRVALLAAALQAAYPNLIFHTATMHWETTFNFLAVAAMLTIVWQPWQHGRVSTRTLLLFAIVLGCAVLVRPVALPVIAAFFVASLLAGAGTRRALAQCAVVLAVVGLMIVPWTIRNIIKLHSPVVVSTGMGIALCQSRNSHASPVLDFAVLRKYCEPRDLAEIPFEKREVEINSYATGKAFESLVHHPGREVGQWWPRARNAFRSDHDALEDAAGHASRDVVRRLEPVADWYFFVVAGASLLGVYEIVRRHSPPRLFFLLVTFSFAATPLILFGDPRYKVPAAPLLIVLAAVGAIGAADRLRTRRA